VVATPGTDAGHPAGLVDLLADCLESDVAQRLANGGVLADGLNQILQSASPVVGVAVVPGNPSTSGTKAGRPPSSADPRLDTVKEILAAMVPIKPGTVMCKTGWFSKKELRVDHPYSICKFPVTQKWYEAVIGTNPSHLKDPQRPVEKVSRHDAQAFCTKLNEVAAGLIGGMRFALPSEARWEYACRAGSTGDFGLLKSSKDGTVDQMAWYAWNSGNQTHRVGQKEANAFGLYDMHGNVWEWCADQGGERRVFCGGGWYDAGENCRAACRNVNHSGIRFSNLGFRPVLTTQNR